MTMPDINIIVFNLYVNLWIFSIRGLSSITSRAFIRDWDRIEIKAKFVTNLNQPQVQLFMTIAAASMFLISAVVTESPAAVK